MNSASEGSIPISEVELLHRKLYYGYEFGFFLNVMQAMYSEYITVSSEIREKKGKNKQ